MKMHRILIATPVYRSVAASCTPWMLLSVKELRKRADVLPCWLHCVGPEVRRNRNILVKTALQMIEQDWTHILWLDGDIECRPYVLDAMLGVGGAIVGAGYPMRGAEHLFAANDGKQHVCSSFRGVMRVEWVGAGLMLTRRDIFEQLAPPWWRNEFVDGEDDQTPEDVGFCLYARRHGYDIHLVGIDGVTHKTEEADDATDIA